VENFITFIAGYNRETVKELLKSVNLYQSYPKIKLSPFYGSRYD